MTTSIRTPPPTTLTTAADALHGEEVVRTKVFVQIAWIIAACVAAASLVLPGDPKLRNALLAVLGVGVLGSIAVYRTLDRASYQARMLVVLACVAVVAGQLGILYVGVTSAAALIVALGLYFFCRTENFGVALAVYLLVAGAHAIEAGLIIAGVIDDPGFAPVSPKLSPVAHAAGQLMLQQMYLMCFFLARLTRRSTLKAIEQLQRATRLAAQRDVQLAELRQDLDRALKIGGPGRFTGHVVGAWTLGNVLGRGAMGEVYEGVGQGGVEGAVKLLRREMLSDPHHVERFFREVRIASSLDSPHVVRVLEASTPEDPIPFLAMERLRGKTLGDIVREGPLAGPRLRALVDQVAAVLERARAANIVHRDLKPHNIFVTDDGIWKVLDFGVAVLADGSGTLTQGHVIGTPTYMAPEQARGEQVDHRADLYALGAIIYRCLTGRVPFAARDTPTLLYNVVHAMPQRPSASAPVTPQQEAFLAVALAKNRIERFDTATELAAAFGAATDGTLDEALQKRGKALLRSLPWTEPEKPD